MDSDRPLPLQIRANGTYRFGDQLRGLIMYTYPTVSRGILYSLIGIAFLSFGIHLLRQNAEIAGTIVLLSGLLFLGLWLIVALLAFIQWVGTPHRGTKVDIVLDDEGLTFESPFGVGKSIWSAFPMWQEGRHLFLIYATRSFFFIIPKRFLASMTDVDRARMLLTARIPKKR